MTNPETRYSGVVDVEFGKDVIVVQPVNLYGCAIGGGSFIGPFVEIQKAAKIGKRCRVQSHSFICELVTIGDDCFISHGRCLSMIHSLRRGRQQNGASGFKPRLAIA